MKRSWCPRCNDHVPANFSWEHNSRDLFDMLLLLASCGFYLPILILLRVAIPQQKYCCTKCGTKVY